jgi:HSP20 family protein
MGLIPWKNKEREGSEDMASPVSVLRTEMDRLVESFFRDPFGTLDWRSAARRGWTPALDISENDEEVTVRAELPGIEPADLEITVSGGQLVLAGEKKESTEESGKNFFHMETRYGSFRRSVPLPEAVDPDRVDAEYSNGVLVIRLKKSPSSPPKRIEVKSKGE